MLNIIIFKGDEVLDALLDFNLKNQWDELFEICKWATIFQKRSFVDIWYNHYSLEYLPILIFGFFDNRIVGVFPLAMTKDNQIVGAGHQQAEYQVWLSTEESSNKFLKSSIQNLQLNFPNSIIHLKYIPELTLIEEIQNDFFFRKISFSKSHIRPFIAIDEDSIKRELSQKNKREKINRLKRLGKLDFVKIDDFKHFSTVIDELIIQNDFRKGAKYGKEYFLNDKYRKDFFLALFKEGLLHVSCLKLNGEIIGSHAGILGENVVHLQGLNSHSPIFARYSPGILHILFLGLHLKAEEIDEFDLTPGGVDGYKRELANKFENCAELIVSNRLNKYKLYLSFFIKEFAKAQISPVIVEKLKIDRIKNLTRKMLIFINIGPFKFFKQLGNISAQNKFQNFIEIYRSKISFNKESANLKLNNISDLLLYNDRNKIHSRKDFLFNCLSKLEFGHKVFTLTNRNELMACFWYVPKNSKSATNRNLKIEFDLVNLVLFAEISEKKLKSFLVDSLNSLFSNFPELDSVKFILGKRDSLFCNLLKSIELNDFNT